MGNRAVLQFKHRNQYNNKVETLPSIYLHWNGGRASVEAFLDVAKKLNIRSDSYGVARLCQIIGNFFGGDLSLGVFKDDFDPGDNGIYIIENFKIIERKNLEIKEEINEAKTKEISEFILDMISRIDTLRDDMYKEEKYK
jgi:hypothetical protein